MAKKKKPAYIKRMLKEHKKLNKKVQKLNKFINDEDGIFLSLPRGTQDLLIAQINVMYAYQTILEIRIKGRCNGN